MERGGGTNNKSAVGDKSRGESGDGCESQTKAAGERMEAMTNFTWLLSRFDHTGHDDTYHNPLIDKSTHYLELLIIGVRAEGNPKEDQLEI